MQAEKRGEGDEDADGESKRRSFRWIIDSEQTAKRGTKHETLFKAVQGLGFIVERVEHGQEFSDYQEVLYFVGQIQ